MATLSEICGVSFGPFPDYREPEWLAVPAIGDPIPLDVGRGGLVATPPTRLWSSPDLAAGTPAPLLIANDGSGMTQSGSLLRWATAYAGKHPLRVVLLDAPGTRDEWYSDNPDYAAWLSEELLVRVRERVAVSAVVGLGASLGAVAMLGWHRRHPESVDALMLQSGSFFTAVFDPQESAYGFFERVCAATVAATEEAPDRRIPIAFTCGAIEENLANNRSMSQRLAAIGYPARFDEVPDAHTMTCWRDAWSPRLEGLLAVG